MSKLAESEVADYPIPYMGIDWSLPYSEVQHPYCPMLRDFTANGEKLEIVRGYETINTEGVTGVSSKPIPVTSTLILIKNTYDTSQCYTINTSTKAFSAIVSAPSTALAALSWHDYCDYVDRTFIYSTNGDVYSYASGTIANAFAIARPPNAVVGGICVYRDRIIVAELKTLYFGATVGATSGSFSTLNLASVIGDTYITSVRALSNSGSVSVQDYLILSCANGKILIYTGDFPGSANWQLISIIPTAQGSGDSPYRTLLQVASDVYYIDAISCQALSIRRLLEAGPAVAFQDSPLSKISTFLSDNSYVITSPLYDNGTNKLYFIVAPTGATNYAISRKEFLQPTSYYDHFLFGIELKNNAISLYSPPVNTVTGGFYRFFENDPYALTLARNGFIYARSYGSNFYRIFKPSGTYTTISSGGDDVTLYPTVYMPYANFGLSNTKSLKMAKVIVSTEQEQNFSLYVDSDFAKTSKSLSEQTEFKFVGGSEFIGTKKVVLPISGTGENFSPCLQTRFQEKFAINRISLQFEQGGPY